MNKYIFYFKYENEDRYLHFPIEAEKDEEAIKEAESYISRREKLGFKIETGYIDKETTETETVWYMRTIGCVERNKNEK